MDRAALEEPCPPGGRAGAGRGEEGGTLEAPGEDRWRCPESATGVPRGGDVRGVH